ncbi:MAG: thioredoxin domain-containing protein [Thermoleophilia bacterium]
MSKKLIGVIVAAAVAIVAVLVVVQLSGSDGPTADQFQKSAPEVEALLKGIPQDGATLGKADAPVTLTEFVDYKCPFCRDAAVGPVKKVITDYVKTGKVKIVLKPIRLGAAAGQGSRLGPDSERGALAGLAAAKQDKMWQFTEILYANQGDESTEWITDAVVEDIVKASGADVDQWKKDYAQDAVVDEMFANEADATAANYTGTPWFVATGPGGTKSFSESSDYEVFRTNLDAVAAKQ